MKISISKKGEFVCMLPNVEKTELGMIDNIKILDVYIYNLVEPISFHDCGYEIETELPWDSQIFTNDLKHEMIDTLDSLIDFDSPEFIESLHK